MNIQINEELENEYFKTNNKLIELFKQKEKMKNNISDIVTLLDYNDHLSEIEHQIVKAEYQARELHVHYRNEALRLFSKSMILAEKEKRQSTYAKNQANIDSQQANTLTDLWEIRFKKMRDTRDSIRNEIFSKHSRYKYMMMEKE
jgi:hypothetical protein